MLRLFDERFQRLATIARSVDTVGRPREATIKVVILAGTGGGTGGGMVIDVANAAKSLASTRNLPVEVHAILIFHCLSGHNAAPLAAANTYALLTELNHATAAGNKGHAEGAAEDNPFESPRAPFDYVYCVPTHPGGAAAHSADTLDMVARYLALEDSAEVRAAFRACRAAQTPRERGCAGAFTLRKFGCASAGDQRSGFIGVLAAELAEAIKRYWLSSDKSADCEQLVRRTTSRKRATGNRLQRE